MRGGAAGGAAGAGVLAGGAAGGFAEAATGAAAGRKMYAPLLLVWYAPNDWRTALFVEVDGLYPSGVTENSGYPRSGSPYCTPGQPPPASNASNCT